MRKSYSFAVLVLAGLIACNDSGSKIQDTQPAVKSADSMTTMHHNMDSSQLSMEQPAIPDGARVFFVNLKDGQTVKSPFTVQMGVEGIALDSAGTIRQASGHHHILIDVGEYLTAGNVIPTDSAHRHFGNAQTQTELSLSPGQHRLTLQYADGIHRSYGQPLSASITVMVQ